MVNDTKLYLKKKNEIPYWIYKRKTQQIFQFKLTIIIVFFLNSVIHKPVFYFFIIIFLSIEIFRHLFLLFIYIALPKIIKMSRVITTHQLQFFITNYARVPSLYPASISSYRRAASDPESIIIPIISNSPEKISHNINNSLFSSIYLESVRGHHRSSLSPNLSPSVYKCIWTTCRNIRTTNNHHHIYKTYHSSIMRRKKKLRPISINFHLSLKESERSSHTGKTKKYLSGHRLKS